MRKKAEQVPDGRMGTPFVETEIVLAQQTGDIEYVVDCLETMHPSELRVLAMACDRVARRAWLVHDAKEGLDKPADMSRSGQARARQVER